jgi:hypothetical protein
LTRQLESVGGDQAADKSASPSARSANATRNCGTPASPLANEFQNSRSRAPSKGSTSLSLPSQEVQIDATPAVWLVDLRARLDQLLDVYRESLQQCTDDLSESEVRIRLVKSQTTLLG